MRTDVLLTERPRWRGVLHTWAFVLAVPAGVALVLACKHEHDHDSARQLAAIMFAGSLAMVLGTSSAYHRLARSFRARRIMQRLDHSMIYLLIVGTYAPLCLVALPAEYGRPLMFAAAIGSAVGVAIKVSGNPKLQWFGMLLYPVLGMMVVAAGPMLLQTLSPFQLTLLVVGGVLYLIGFPILILRWPDPWPNAFGYHEIFHALTVVAAACHFASITLLLA